MTYLSRVTLPNRRRWAILELEAGSIVWAIKRSRASVIGIPVVIVSHYQA